jgi:predicted nucleic acid-binding protein
MSEGFVLDTNVVAELERPRPDPTVVGWFSRQPAHRLFLTATVVAELWYGIELKPEGARRNRLTSWLQELLQSGFADRVLPFDATAARIWGRLMAEGRRAGRLPDVRDVEIAAVAMANSLALATRNARDFECLGLAWLDPWQETA